MQRIMNTEVNRRLSFNSWNYKLLDKDIMARIGLFANSKGLICCNFCTYQLTQWTCWIDEVASHKTASPTCPIFHNTLANNALSVTRLAETIEIPTPQSYPLRINIYGIHHNYQCPQFANNTFKKRKLTFSRAPQQIQRISNKLASAGFHYRSDSLTYCSSCNLAIGRWNTRAIPLYIHALASPFCSYLNSTQTQDFINEVQNLRDIIIDTMVKADCKSPASRSTTIQTIKDLNKKLYPLVKLWHFSIIDIVTVKIDTNKLNTQQLPMNSSSDDPKSLLSNEVLAPSPTPCQDLPSFESLSQNSSSTSYDEIPTFSNPHNDIHSLSPTSSPPALACNPNFHNSPFLQSNENHELFPISPEDLFVSLYTINFNINNNTEITDFASIIPAAKNLFSHLNIALKQRYHDLFTNQPCKALLFKTTFIPSVTPFECFQKCYNQVISCSFQDQNSDCPNLWHLLASHQQHKYVLLAHNYNQRKLVKQQLNLLFGANYYVARPSLSYFYELTTDRSKCEAKSILLTLKQFLQESVNAICNNPQNHNDFYSHYYNLDEIILQYDTCHHSSDTTPN